MNIIELKNYYLHEFERGFVRCSVTQDVSLAVLYQGSVLLATRQWFLLGHARN